MADKNKEDKLRYDKILKMLKMAPKVKLPKKQE